MATHDWTLCKANRTRFRHREIDGKTLDCRSACRKHVPDFVWEMMLMLEPNGGLHRELGLPDGRVLRISPGDGPGLAGPSSTQLTVVDSEGTLVLKLLYVEELVFQPTLLRLPSDVGFHRQYGPTPEEAALADPQLDRAWIRWRLQHGKVDPPAHHPGYNFEEGRERWRRVKEMSDLEFYDFVKRVAFVGGVPDAVVEEFMDAVHDGEAYVNKLRSQLRQIMHSPEHFRVLITCVNALPPGLLAPDLEIKTFGIPYMDRQVVAGRWRVGPNSTDLQMVLKLPV
jgi:hypothetical protein